MTSAAEWRVEVGEEETRAVYEPATAGDDRAVFICAHGAGGSMSDRSTLAAANALRAAGFGVVRFNFLYKELRKGRPDAMPKLMATTADVVSRTRAELGDVHPLVIGGRSMGGRAASMLAADGFDADGLLLLAYPLHPEGQPDKLRDAHLSRITMPVICFNGTRDGLCRRDLMERALESVTTSWEMHWLEGADHSFHVLKSSGHTDAQVLADVASASAAWVARLPVDVL